MVIDCSQHTFKEPQRAILNPADVKKWEQSCAYQDIMGFITSMNTAVKGKGCSTPCAQTEIVSALLAMLDTITQWVDDFPPMDQPQRYGNKAFRDFYDKLKKESRDIIKTALPEEFNPAVSEISVYLEESFGNSTRIDYGTGHELAFIMFLCCIFKIGALKQHESVAVVTKIFNRYLMLCRKLQMTYKMEPAGSHGVWSLDDYQFIPFIWGSSQLQMNPKIAPEMFCNEKIVNENANEYIFLGCIQSILSVKTGPFAEHSNQLWNISGVQSWTKINQGLIKMYKVEVLHKFPVVQHVLFGSILSIAPSTEMVYHPPGTDMPSLSGRIPGALPSYMTPMPGPGPLLTDDMPLSVPGMGRMAQDVPQREGLFTLPTDVTVSQRPFDSSSEVAASRATSAPCVEARHPAMSPINPLPAGGFTKCNIATESTAESTK